MHKRFSWNYLLSFQKFILVISVIFLKEDFLLIVSGTPFSRMDFRFLGKWKAWGYLGESRDFLGFLPPILSLNCIQT